MLWRGITSLVRPRRRSVVRINGNVPWLIRSAEEGCWVGVCEPLQLTVQSETWAELMEDIGLTLDAMFLDLLSTNELDRFLRDRGWTAIGATKHSTQIQFDVPFVPSLAHDSAATVHH